MNGGFWIVIGFLAIAIMAIAVMFIFTSVAAFSLIGFFGFVISEFLLYLTALSYGKQIMDVAA